MVVDREPCPVRVQLEPVNGRAAVRDGVEELGAAVDGALEVRSGGGGVVEAGAGHGLEQGVIDVVGGESPGAGIAGVGRGLGVECGVGVVGRLVLLVPGVPTGTDGGEEKNAGAGQHDPQSADESCLSLRLVGYGAFLGFGEGGAGVEELVLGHGELGVRALLPLPGLGETEAAVQLARGAAQDVPALGGGGEVVQDPLPFDVVLEPAAQPGPGAGECLVRNLDDAVVTGDEAHPDEPVHEFVLGGVGDDLAAGQPGPYWFAYGAGEDETQQQVTEVAPLVRVELAIEGLGGLRDGAADAAGGLVAGDGEGASFAA